MRGLHGWYAHSIMHTSGTHDLLIYILAAWLQLSCFHCNLAAWLQLSCLNESALLLMAYRPQTQVLVAMPGRKRQQLKREPAVSSPLPWGQHADAHVLVALAPTGG